MKKILDCIALAGFFMTLWALIYLQVDPQGEVAGTATTVVRSVDEMADTIFWILGI